MEIFVFVSGYFIIMAVLGLGLAKWAKDLTISDVMYASTFWPGFILIVILLSSIKAYETVLRQVRNG